MVFPWGSAVALLILIPAAMLIMHINVCGKCVASAEENIAPDFVRGGFDHGNYRRLLQEEGRGCETFCVESCHDMVSSISCEVGGSFSFLPAKCINCCQFTRCRNDVHECTLHFQDHISQRCNQ